MHLTTGIGGCSIGRSESLVGDECRLRSSGSNERWCDVLKYGKLSRLASMSEKSAIDLGYRVGGLRHTEAKPVWIADMAELSTLGWEWNPTTENFEKDVEFDGFASGPAKSAGGEAPVEVSEEEYQDAVEVFADALGTWDRATLIRNARAMSRANYYEASGDARPKKKTTKGEAERIKALAEREAKFAKLRASGMDEAVIAEIMKVF